MGFDSKFFGRRLGGSKRLYVKALVLKEVCKVRLMYAGAI